ncbi:LytR C-terminal domain-containing protein [Isoptericola sp. b515]|uniref:LytR C-terminal domain-containing protein n=1 Tax=Isoptericola sp. b515 TaxID=3064652 RepID=UPI00271409B8|nr:LytR C-terminal domain-containing protein [Isoptericola sp. b515]MDO8149197.1 LytR C-terminal domain-containing protein [Isoptericola sp. b515]
MTSPAQDPARVARRRRKHERQAVVFGLLIALMVILGLGALAVYTETIDSPISEPIVTPEPASASIEPACLPVAEKWPDGTPPMEYSKVKVRIYNAADYTFNLASANADALTERGFDVRDTGDFTYQIEGPSEIRYGIKGVRQAYTLAAQYENVRLVMDDRSGSFVDLIVGQEWQEPLSVEEVPLETGEPMTNAPGCVPPEDLDPVEREYGYERGPNAGENADEA